MSGEIGFVANATINITYVTLNLVITVVTNKRILYNMVENNKKLADQLKMVLDSVKRITKKNTKLIALVGAAAVKQNNTPSGKASNNAHTQRKYEQKNDVTGYF